MEGFDSGNLKRYAKRYAIYWYAKGIEMVKNMASNVLFFMQKFK